MKDSIRFYWLLLGAFFLEMSAYLAFPYLSLQLRGQFGFSPPQIGKILMWAIWIRPLAALAGGALSTRLRPLTLFAGACIAESICFLLLGSAKHAPFAVIAIVLGNIGFSIWKPSVFALSYGGETPEANASRLALLNGVFNSGAACGCLLSAVIIRMNASAVFLSSGVLYLFLVPLFIPILREEQAEKARTSADGPAALAPLLRWETVAIIMMTLGFWASYSQFNSFFSLFANDWLRDPQWTGLAFALVTVFVALSSLALSRWQALARAIHRATAVATVFFALGWVLMVSRCGVPSVFFFLIAISIGEALFSVLLADSWGKLLPGRKQLMQSLNFSFRSLAMGAGGFLGGMFYRPPSPGNSLTGWGMQNVVLLGVSFLGMIISLNRPLHGDVR